MSPKQTPPFAAQFSYTTAVNLHNILTQQLVHAQQQAKDGYPVLLSHFETLNPFYKALTAYVESHS